MNNNDLDNKTKQQNGLYLNLNQQQQTISFPAYNLTSPGYTSPVGNFPHSASANDLISKFNQIALIDQQQKGLSSNNLFQPVLFTPVNNTTPINSLINNFNQQRIPAPFVPNYTNNKPVSYNPHIPPAPPLVNDFYRLTSQSISQQFHPTHYQQPVPLQQQPQQPKLTEQELLDKNFLYDLFDKKTTNATPTERPRRSPNLSLKPNIPVVLNHQQKLVPKTDQAEKNLIDLDVLDIKNLSVIDLFDPLAQPAIIKTPTPPPQLKQEPEPQPTEPVSVNKIEPEKPVDEIKPTTTTTRKKSLRRQPSVNKRKKKPTSGNQIENFNIVDLTHLDEFHSFETSINELSTQISVETKQLASLIVFSPVLDCPITSRKTIKITIKYTKLTHDGAKQHFQETVTPSLSASVETFVYHVLVSFNFDDLNPKKYLLKVHGLEEYLPLEVCLNELRYLHECIIENREPVLILTELNMVNTELSAPNSTDSLKLFKVFNNKLDKNRNQITKAKLETLLRSIVQNKKLIEESIESNFNYSYTNQLDSVINWCINLKEKIKYLIQLVYNVHYSVIEEVLIELDTIEKNLRNYQTSVFLKDKQPLMMSLVNSMDDLNSTHGSTDSNLNEIYLNLVESTGKTMNAILAFINCACSSFNLAFSLQPVYAVADEAVAEQRAEPVPNSKMEIIQSDDKLQLQFYGVNRLGQLLNEFKSNLGPDLLVKFSVMYGTRVYDSVLVRLDKYEKLNNRKQDYFSTNQRIVFKRIDLCLLPRESILLIQLCSVSNTISLNNSFSEEKMNKCLAWSSISLFKDDLSLQSGGYLSCMFTGETPLLCTSASNTYSDTCPVVQIAFMNDDYTFTYPSLTNECECSLKDFQTLTPDVKENLLEICNKSVIADTLNEDEKDLIHQYYLYLNEIPNALNKVYLSFSSYDYSSLINFYAYLKKCGSVSLTESLELLLANFPDSQLRNHAVNSLKGFSPETVSLYLPQLLEALKYERTHDSELAKMLLSFASKNIRFAHKLYWQISEFNSRKEDFLQIRYELLYQALLHLFSQPMISEIEQELFLIRRINEIGLEIKKDKDNNKLFEQLEYFGEEWSNKTPNGVTCRLPYNISYCTREVDIKACSYISSFTCPLKLVFKNIDSSANSFYTIYKIGDDLRQDMFVLQLINVMNQLWINEDHDLSVLTFTCLQTGDKRGFIEMVTNAETLKEIQKGEVRKAFKKSCINDWLKTHNPNPNNFKKAVTNFTKSCAGYSVATYILGIGDRHNDNIMIKYTGHMFHIDFGKYLGDAQTFAGFKRDRTPILFTPDMFYVINQGKEANSRFQEFIEMCTKAFQILRKNYHHLLSLIELMSSSGIPGLNKNAIQYVYKNLMIDMSEDASSNAFKKLIFESLSRFGSFNFAIHTLAQPKTVNATNYFSFVTHTFNAETDGKILSVNLVELINQNSLELFKCVVNREMEYDTNEVYRTYDEFCELYQLLTKTFSTLKLSETLALNKFKETRQSIKRRQQVECLIKDIFKLTPEISQSDIIYTFFHSILRDQKEDVNDTEMIDITSANSSDENEELRNLNDNQDMFYSDMKGQIKIKLKYKDNKFYVNCLQCRNLKPPNNQTVASLKPYVKCYLRPDVHKLTKKKVQALFNGANPIFTETMEYDISLIDIKNRTLEISVINNKLNNKERIGSVEIRLYDIDWNNNEYVKWYDLR